MARTANDSDSDSTDPDMPRLEVVKDPFIPDFEIVEDPDMPLKDPGTPDLEQVEDTWYFDEWNYFREGFTWWTKEKDTGVWKPVYEKTKWWFDSWNDYVFGFRWWIKQGGALETCK